MHTFSNAVLEIGLQIGLKFRVCLYDRLGTWTAKADYFFLILTQANAPYAWPGPGPPCPSAVLSYPVKANRFMIWLMHCPGWTSAWGSISAAPWAQHSALLTLHLCPPSSLQLEFPVSVLPSHLPASLCNSPSHPLQTQKCLKKPIPPQGSSHPPQSSHVDFSTKTTRACWSGSRGAMKMI